MTPDAYCQQKAAASGSSFYYSFLFLPPERRRAITALYAYCREVDDVVDEATDTQIAASKLQWWSQEIERLYSGEPQHPVTRALAPHVRQFDLTRDQLLQVIEGMSMDLSQTRYVDFVSLGRYCHLVAGVVGELSASIFGATHADTLQYARKLGLALQLINIIRDVGEDARRGRIYLPSEDLHRFGVKAGDLLASRYVDGFSDLMHFQAQRARSVYADALAILPAVDRRTQRTGLIMGAIYAALLEELGRSDFQVLHQRIALTPLRKLFIAWKTWTFGSPVLMPRDMSGPHRVR